MLKFFLRAGLASDGNSLVLAVLILLTLSSVGVISIQHTNTDLIISGNLMRVAKNELVTEAATGMANANLKVSTMEEVQTPYDQQRRGPVLEGDLGANVLNQQALAGRMRYSTADPDPSTPSDGTLFLPVVAPSSSDDPTPVMVDQGMAYEVDFYPVVISNAAIPGNDTGISICYLVVDVDSKGATPTGFQPAAETLNGEVIRVHSRSRMVAGPVRCNE